MKRARDIAFCCVLAVPPSAGALRFLVLGLSAAPLMAACGPAGAADPRIADPAKALREALSRSGDPPLDVEITSTYLRMTYSTGIVVLPFTDVGEVKYGRDLRGLLVEVSSKDGKTLYFFVATSDANARKFMDALDAIRGKKY